MTPTVLELEFRGQATALAPGVLLVRASAPGTPFGAGEALLEARLSLLGHTGLDLAGTVSLGAGAALRFRTLGLGVLGSTPEPALRHGAAVCEIDGGAGALQGATGRMTSNFVLADSGELTDRQVYLVFTDPALVERAPSSVGHLVKS